MVEIGFSHKLISKMWNWKCLVKTDFHTLTLEAINRHFRATLIQAYLYDLQIAVESWRSKMNVKKPHSGLFEDEK